MSGLYVDGRGRTYELTLLERGSCKGCELSENCETINCTDRVIRAGFKPSKARIWTRGGFKNKFKEFEEKRVKVKENKKKSLLDKLLSR